MKNVLFALVGLMILGSGVASAAPKSYAMVCRGGSGTLGYSGNGGVTSGVFYFRKAPSSVAHGLNAGECAWLDRAIGASEPPCLMQKGISVSAWIFPDQLQNSYFSSNSNNGAWMRSLLKASNYQTFQAYNPGNGCFVVTKVGP